MSGGNSMSLFELLFELSSSLEESLSLPLSVAVSELSLYVPLSVEELSSPPFSLPLSVAVSELSLSMLLCAELVGELLSLPPFPLLPHAAKQERAKTVNKTAKNFFIISLKAVDD